MKPHEFEALVRAQAIETTQEPIAESAPIPVLKPMNINQLDRQYNALLGESSLREFAGNDLDESVAETTMAGGTEAYTMEDEQLDGMALGELQAIAQAAKKIYASVKQGVPLEAWMYKKITNGNEGLTAVAQQINNPAVREQPGVAEGAPIVVMPSHKRLEKKHKPSLSRGMDPAKAQGEQDARDGKPYNNPYPFKKELGAPGNWEHNSYKASYDSVKKGVAEGHADQQRKVFKKNGKPVGEVGIDRESSPGNGQWYMKCYSNGIDNVGYDSYEEAVAELKHCLKQGVAEGEFTIKDDPSAHIRILFLKTINGNEYRLVKQGNVYKIYINSGKKQVFSSFDLAKKALQQLLLNAVHTDDPVVAEGFPDDILAMAKKVSPNARIRGSRDEEIARRDAMLAQRAQDHANAPEPKGVSDDERASLEAELQQLMPKYDRHYQMIDNYTQHMQAKHIADRVHEIQRKLKLGVAEGWDPEDDEQWSAEDPKDEMFGAGDAYKRGIQDYRKFMQTKVKPSNPYSYTKQARQADNWEKGFEDGRYKQGMSEIKDPNDSRWSQKYNKDLPESTDYASAVNNLLNEFAGGMGVSSVAVGPGAMKNPARVGSLFGGSYNPKSPFKKKTKKESIIKR